MLLKNSKKIIIKLGSSTVVDNKGQFKVKWVNSLIKDIKKFKKNSQIVIVSSGAIALGKNILNIKKKKIQIEMSQAIAAVGQIKLAEEFQKIFKKNKFKTGQILISLDDTEQRRRALNVRRTFENLFKLKAIPIVNENDTTATAEIKYGDNDRLEARVAQIIGADSLIILSDVDGLYDKSKERKLINEVKEINDNLYTYSYNQKNSYGSGGITTKLDAAKICMNSGCFMYIGNGKNLNPITKMFSSKRFTCFTPKISSLAARKKWIIGSLNSSGEIAIDDGAVNALANGKSLLAAGVILVKGNFKKGENILISDKKGNKIARGLTSFSSLECEKIKGSHSKEIQKILGYPSKSEIIHKDDMVIL